MMLLVPRLHCARCGAQTVQIDKPFRGVGNTWNVVVMCPTMKCPEHLHHHKVMLQTIDSTRICDYDEAQMGDDQRRVDRKWGEPAEDGEFRLGTLGGPQL